MAWCLLLANLVPNAPQKNSFSLIFLVANDDIYCRILVKEREKEMFHIGDKVIVTSFNTPQNGVIVDWYYDEGDVWVVKIESHGTIDCCNSELSPV